MIIKSHTVVAAPGYSVKEGRASMGEYNHFLTVQELVDLVAFLKQGTNPALNSVFTEANRAAGRPITLRRIP